MGLFVLVGLFILKGAKVVSLGFVLNDVLLDS